MIYPDKQQVKHSASGYDLLYHLMIPDVEVDRQNETVSSFQGDVTLYINGRKADAIEIRNLRSKEVKKIEYYDIPTGRYINDDAAINFILKEKETGGYISLNGEQHVGYLDGRYGLATKLHHKNVSYVLFAGHTQSRNGGTNEERQEHFVFEDYETDRHSATISNQVKNNNEYFQFGVYNQGKKNNLNGKLLFVRDASPDNYYRNMLEYNQNGDVQTNFKYTDQSGWKSSIELYGYFQLCKQQFIEATVGGLYANNDYAYNYQEGEYGTLTRSKEDLYDLFAEVNYGVQFERKNSLSVQLSHYQTVSAVDYAGEVSAWQHFRIGESLLFLEYSQKLNGKLSFKLAPGISYIQYRLHHADKKDKYTPRLRSTLIYRPSKNHQLQLSYRIGNNQVQISEVNEVDQRIDSLQIRRGNPDQKTSFLNTFMAAYSGQLNKFNISVNAVYNGVNHNSMEDIYVEGNNLIRSYRTDCSVRYFTSRIAATWKASDRFRIKLVGNWQYVRFKSTAEKLHAFSANMQADYYWKDFSFGLFAYTQTKSINYQLAYLSDPAKYGVYVNWSHNAWQVEGGVRNPFYKHPQSRSWMNRDVYQYNSLTTSKLNHTSGYIKVTYTFNFGKKVSHDYNDVDKMIDSGIMKLDK